MTESALPVCTSWSHSNGGQKFPLYLEEVYTPGFHTRQILPSTVSALKLQRFPTLVIRRSHGSHSWRVLYAALTEFLTPPRRRRHHTVTATTTTTVTSHHQLVCCMHSGPQYVAGLPSGVEWYLSDLSNPHACQRGDENGKPVTLTAQQMSGSRSPRVPGFFYSC